MSNSHDHSSPGRAAGTRPSGWILIVEDEPALADVLSRALSRTGYSVEVRETARGGLYLLETRREPPRLLVLDVMLPDMEGSYVAAALKIEHPDVPVLGISGMSEHEVRHSELHADRLLLKPFSVADFLSTVEVMVEGTAPG